MTMTLHDLARFGLLFTPSWKVVSEERIVSEAHLRRLLHGGRPELLQGHEGPEWWSPVGTRHASCQWDGIGVGGELFKGGLGNQLLFIATQADVVIAHFGTNPDLETPPLLLPLRRMVAELFPAESHQGSRVSDEPETRAPSQREHH